MLLPFLVETRGLDSRRLAACSVVAALTASKAVIHSRSLRFPSGKKRKTAFSGFSFLVTPTGIEPMIAP